MESIQLSDQVTQMRAAAALTERAVGFGAREAVMWTFYSFGVVQGSLEFKSTPKPSELDPWRLAIGSAYEVFSVPSKDGLYVTHYWTFTYGGQQLKLAVSEPVTEEVMS